MRIIALEMRNIALCMELSDFYEHGIARGLVRYAKAKPDWRLFGYGWMFRSLTDLGRWDGDGIIARVEDAADRRQAVESRPARRRRRRSLLSASFPQRHQRRFPHRLQGGPPPPGCGFSRFAFLGVRGRSGRSERRKDSRRDSGARPGPGTRTGLGERSRLRAILAWWERLESQAEERESLAAFSLASSARPRSSPATTRRASRHRTRRAPRASRSRTPSPYSASITRTSSASSPRPASRASCSTARLSASAPRPFSTPRSRAPQETAPAALPRARASPCRQGRGRARVDADLRLRGRARREGRHLHPRARPRGHRRVRCLALVSASRRSLETRFRATMGRSLHEEIVRAKLARAKRLLRESDETVERIAEESGFGALGRFHEAFKGVEGIPPGEWRKRQGMFL